MAQFLHIKLLRELKIQRGNQKKQPEDLRYIKFILRGGCMENLAYVGLSRQISLWDSMETTANNMANISTPGYKMQKRLFREYLNSSSLAEDAASQKVSQVQDYATFSDYSQGSIKKTFNDFDLAINGEGFFAIQTSDGTGYTRDGSFQLNSAGELVTRSGNKVLNSGGAPVTIPEDASRVTISKDGTVSTDLGEVGKLKIANFESPEHLILSGDNLLRAGDEREIAVATPNVEQGALEQSNVEPVLEMNRMIEIQRMFQATQNMLETDHDMKRSTIRTLTQV